ncbi:aldose epimerase [Mycolicibacterium canariasense]|uniref:Aldose epimerase n=1 Tax=Mycolicibacterium canariasense TaxID=228230 RepID=A0A100WHF3_MYCCR|nr:aldose 1-epimerase family protein [Mycolicibacterium canariasense]ORU95304.1 aldose epimerase [Mycolicibacterium canariasense]GAS98677.1 aldose epimerase [Mycolicibacterium canariasense]
MHTDQRTVHGVEYTLADGPARAVITGVGAAIRALAVGGVDLTPGYRGDRLRPFYSGTVLAPWPNRVRDARWVYRGSTQLLDVTEPQRDNALHGLLCFTEYRLMEQTATTVMLGAQVFPQHGYPFHLDTTVLYRLAEDGLRATHTVENLGSDPAPVALGTHPFLCIGGVPTSELTLTVSADTHIDVDERLNPTGTSPVQGSYWDLRVGRRVADLDLDDAWTGLHITDGGSVHSLRAPDGQTVSLWADQQFGYIQVFTTRRYPVGDQFVTAVAVEPMTAPADALNSGEGLRWLEPGDSWSASWSIRYRAGSQ